MLQGEIDSVLFSALVLVIYLYLHTWVESRIASHLDEFGFIYDPLEDRARGCHLDELLFENLGGDRRIRSETLIGVYGLDLAGHTW